MGNLFSTPKVQPDKAAQAAAARQSALADNQLTESLQTNIIADTRTAWRNFGLQPASTSSAASPGNGFGGYGGGFGYGGGWFSRGR